MINFHNKKTRSIFAGIICAVLIAAMVLSVVVYAGA
jgi:hypothetical protein